MPKYTFTIDVVCGADPLACSYNFQAKLRTLGLTPGQLQALEKQDVELSVLHVPHAHQVTVNLLDAAPKEWQKKYSGAVTKAGIQVVLKTLEVI